MLFTIYCEAIIDFYRFAVRYIVSNSNMILTSYNFGRNFVMEISAKSAAHSGESGLQV